MVAMRVSGELVTFKVTTCLVAVMGQRTRSGAGADADRDPEQELELIADEGALRNVEVQMVKQLAGTKHGELQELREQTAQSELGDVFVDDVIVRRGSMELLGVVTAAFKLIKDFNEFVEVLGEAAENVRRACRAFLHRL